MLAAGKVAILVYRFHYSVAVTVRFALHEIGPLIQTLDSAAQRPGLKYSHQQSMTEFFERCRGVERLLSLIRLAARSKAFAPLILLSSIVCISTEFSMVVY